MTEKNSLKLSFKKKVAFIIATILIICFTNIAIIEIIFGNWFSPNKLNRLSIIKNAKLFYDIKGLYPYKEKKIIYTRDKFGLRGQYASTDSIDIMTVGGSTTDQRFLSDGETWQDYLAKEFAKNEKKVNIANAGVDGQTTYGHIKNFDWWFPLIPKLKVKYFLFYIGINDLFISKNQRYDDLVNPNSLKTIIKERSALYLIYNRLKGVYLARKVANLSYRKVDFSKGIYTNEPLLKNHNEILKNNMTDLSKRLEILIEKSNMIGAIPIFVTQSSLRYKKSGDKIVGASEIFDFDNVKINGLDQYYMMQIINNTIKETCKLKGVMCIDLASELEWEDCDFYDFYHNTPKGAEKIGKYLYIKLKYLF